ncbi:hypothetical protein A2196_05890 [Candidatus Curtissbacteria bacterium RIFOXYA1_FULL_41_14]|uniref:Thioredoxin-like fold domain-containing protein n=1 Tax=Candidatus Curtissbacteria bacterium RIFOXYA1_FULL_41_14 TaxID=1797737 RepID=A0A1F5HGK1_9BACT|nr:MAG: hypothetical protein A2196_05890 [Candidatus Curtissbacteria bacterium RIFOXYA1_FULL_41_14]
MTIQVLGSGCPTCKKLHQLTQQAVKELGLKDDVEYITDVAKLIEMGVMQSPVLAVDSKPVLVGFVPSIEKIKETIKTGQANNQDCCKDKDCDCNPGCC